jgi:ribosomal protein L12E/L44/L45/RPP1/RPP2
VRYKVATIISAMDDVELHDLHGVFHAGRSPTAAAASTAPPAPAAELSSSKRAKKRRKRRAEGAQKRECATRRSCWRRNPDGTCGWHYEEGVGVADWLSKYY